VEQHLEARGFRREVAVAHDLLQQPRPYLGQAFAEAAGVTSRKMGNGLPL
jgi:hypothetical protein